MSGVKESFGDVTDHVKSLFSLLFLLLPIFHLQSIGPNQEISIRGPALTEDASKCVYIHVYVTIMMLSHLVNYKALVNLAKTLIPL